MTKHWPTKLEEITRLQIELTSFCNAKCLSCERQNFDEHEFIYNKKLNSTYIKFDEFISWFNYDFPSLKSFYFSGNVDEPTLNPDLIKICEYIVRKYNDVNIFISTNGGTRDKIFWRNLAKIKNVKVIFGIDGNEETNTIYRKNVNWKKLEENFSCFIENGGYAIWQFIEFDHNQHQIDIMKKYAEQKKFMMFMVRYSNRENKGVNAINYSNNEDSFILCKATTDDSVLEKSFFVDFRGNVWPCCWMGTNLNMFEFYQKIGKKFDSVLSNNLNYLKLHEITESDMFGYLYNNLKCMTVCEKMCKKNKTDIDFYEKL